MTDGSSENVRAGSRILAVLQAMNRQPYSTILSLHQATGLPKPTLIRLLKTLVTEGFVSKDRRQAGYQVTSLVTSLSSGFRGDPMVVEAGRAWAIELSERFKWPAAIAVFDKDAVVVRFSTVHDSPVSPFHATINMRLGLLTRALGRAYLAGCSNGRIESLLTVLRASGDEEDALAHDSEAVARMVKTVRERGYALRDRNVPPASSDTVAAPIFARGKVLGSLGVTYFRSAVNSFDPEHRLVLELQRSAREIGAEVERLLSASD